MGCQYRGSILGNSKPLRPCTISPDWLSSQRYLINVLVFIIGLRSTKCLRLQGTLCPTTSHWPSCYHACKHPAFTYVPSAPSLKWGCPHWYLSAKQYGKGEKCFKSLETNVCSHWHFTPFMRNAFRFGVITPSTGCLTQHIGSHPLWTKCSTGFCREYSTWLWSDRSTSMRHMPSATRHISDSPGQLMYQNEWEIPHLEFVQQFAKIAIRWNPTLITRHWVHLLAGRRWIGLKRM